MTQTPKSPPALSSLSTETRNAATERLDEASSLEICELMNREDAQVAEAVARALPLVAQVV
ncbi:MAG: hypothetical protein M3Y56_11135, partial [Armatimonadota bacterium]|nr:hypothetical protein [Armatimonadota bacterium]